MFLRVNAIFLPDFCTQLYPLVLNSVFIRYPANFMLFIIGMQRQEASRIGHCNAWWGATGYCNAGPIVETGHDRAGDGRGEMVKVGGRYLAFHRRAEVGGEDVGELRTGRGQPGRLWGED